ncbi:MAG: hypothetical protein IJX26_01585, partial [Clostridia bacterium]|nr:hypothetical protein [Clostridia bacterium]
ATKTSIELNNLKSLDFAKLNEVLLNRYKLLGGEFLNKLHKHREKQYFLASSDGLNLIPKDYAQKQINLF